MELMLWRETPTASASSCWVHAFATRRSFTRLRTSPSMTSALYTRRLSSKLDAGEMLRTDQALVDAHEAQVEDVVGPRDGLHALPHRPHDVAVRERDERRVGVHAPHRVVEELRPLGGIEFHAPLVDQLVDLRVVVLA